jgi:hypothetical protein
VKDKNVYINNTQLKFCIRDMIKTGVGLLLCMERKRSGDNIYPEVHLESYPWNLLVGLLGWREKHRFMSTPIKSFDRTVSFAARKSYLSIISIEQQGHLDYERTKENKGSGNRAPAGQGSKT